MFFKNKRGKHQEDLNQKVSKYQKWWQDQTEELSLGRSTHRRNRKSPESQLKTGQKQKTWDDSFVYHEGN
jgi:hypothetical protein